MSDELKSSLALLRKRLAEALPTGDGEGADLARSGLLLGRRVVQAYDQLLGPLFARVPTAGVTLAAVGGYGRGAVALRSDLDVRIVVRDPTDAAAVVDAVLYPMWDASFAIGHQVLGTADALDVAREDLATATSLLDFRHLAGDRALGAELIWRASGSLFTSSELGHFCARLEEEMASRHERFGDSLYLLEPDVKNGAGGLRDLDVFRWAASARYGTGEADGLVRVGALVPREAQELVDAQELLWRIRNLLHFHAARRSDRLTFDQQEQIAPLLGFGPDSDGVERFMSAYYRAAGAVSRSVARILARALPADRRRPKYEDLGADLASFDGAITVKDPERLRREPALPLRALAVALERHAPLHAFLRDSIMSIATDLEWCERLRGDVDARRLFVELVGTRREGRYERREGKRASALKEMHALGLLTAMIPEFLPVVGRVHHDLYHVYTVDVHSVAAVDRLAALSRGELTREHPLASRLAAETARPAMLAFATLLHDVGKAIGGKDHSVRGAEMARTILARLDFKDEDIDEACALIFEHLTMYRLATRRDVDDPSTAAEMIAAVRGREGLRDLFLLTVADVSTTSPTSMTSWKAHMLEELYMAADGALSGVPQHEELAARASRAVLELADSTGREAQSAPHAPRSAPGFLAAYLASMPERYVLSSSAESILAHAAVAEHAGEGQTRIALVPSSHADAAELCVVSPDRPGLLAKITAALAVCRLEVHAANIYSRAHESGVVSAVDLFWVRDRSDGVAGVERAIPRLERDLAALLQGTVEKRELVSRVRPSKQRGTPRVPTRVTVDHRASPLYTVIEVATHDRPGVLFAMSNALFELGVSIAIAKINTEGARVADVFYVTERGGAKLAPGARTQEVEAALVEAVGGAAEPAPAEASG